jgi:formylglycine-generating enzyme required for sulfatase activity
MDTVDVIQSEYQELMNVNPSYFAGNGNNPVDRVTWFDAVLYCNARSKKAGKDSVYSYTSVVGTPGNGCSGLTNITIDFAKNGYRLPTEAEWEYACRAGSSTAYYWSDDTSYSTVNKYAWYSGNTDSNMAVSMKLPNAYHLYDMAGDVWQWCNDYYGTYSADAQTDPTGPSTNANNYHVLRGGSWAGNVGLLRSANRMYGIQDNQYLNGGFRCVRR